MQKTIQIIASKFHETAFEEEDEHQQNKILQRKLGEFRTLMLVFRGQNIEEKIDQIYDRTEMRFKKGFAEGVDDYFGSASTLFLSNSKTNNELIEFFIKEKFVNMFTDFSSYNEHLNSSIDYLGLL